MFLYGPAVIAVTNVHTRIHCVLGNKTGTMQTVKYSVLFCL